MIRDRGAIKWTSMMLPEHVNSLKEILVDEQKVKQPELDEQAIQEFELIICEAMAFNKQVTLKFYENGFIKTVPGFVHFIDHLKNKMVIRDSRDEFHHIPFHQLVNIQPE
ncbi:YolD-like family protein [Neobacillus jeddahensis]|uniref:YolD-like family protein n=1 Tax=Neobacillus jeddahensis TaxID=1461580 RepID=UPI000591493A|nr:YolD-like family protein [Neobacillus jeddahensis]